ncbi:MAG: molybdopterin-guanine dinucleotide biosynthesis protein MobB [Kiloniellaceae bacterium]
MIATAKESLLKVEDTAAAPDFRSLTGDELRRSKRAYVTARFDLTRADRLLTAKVGPKAGDLLLARVARLGHHRKLESPEGRRQVLFENDLVLVCYGARYASDQFEAVVPERIGPCSLVAAGGIAGSCTAKHDSARKPTEIEPLGLVADVEGQVLNLVDCAEPRIKVRAQNPYTLAVVGTSMNAGKTTTVAAMIRGLAKTGLRVGAAKITGTGAGCDRWAMVDAGADAVLDFTDFGHASTYQVPLAETAAILEAAVGALGREGCDVVVVELADGLLFSETAELVEHPTFDRLISGLVLAAADSMSAGFGAAWLMSRDLPLVGLTGKLTSSPLMVREFEEVSDIPALSLADLESGGWTRLIGRDLKRDAA